MLYNTFYFVFYSYICDVRTFNEIMIDADNSETISELRKYADELYNNKKKFPLIQLWFAQEYFKELYTKIEENEFRPKRVR